MSLTYTPIGPTDQIDAAWINAMGDLIIQAHLLSARIVNSLDSLRGLTGTDLAGACTVLGNDTVGDAGGGVFYWDAVSTEADDDASIIAPSGGGTGRWKLMTTPDTAAIAALQADINHLQAGQGYDDAYPSRIYDLVKDVTGSDSAHAYGVSPTFTADAGTNQLTATGHGLVSGAHVCVESAGTLPAGLAEYTNYYVRVVDANTLTLHPTPGDAAANTNIVDIGDTGTGSHYLGWTFAHHSPLIFYGQGAPSGTPIMKVTDTTAKLMFFGNLINHTGKICVYARLAAGGPFTALATLGASGQISGRRTLSGLLATETFEFYLAPCSGNGVMQTSQTLSYELDISATNL